MKTDEISTMMQQNADQYRSRLIKGFDLLDWGSINKLADKLMNCFHENRQVFVCGNGGSGANAIHIANDFLYGITKRLGAGLRCKALTANSSVITCLANDENYSEIFAYQIAVEADPGDVLLVLSGSGNSQNILRAIEVADEKGLSTFAILGFDGGKAKDMVKTSIHAPVNDMQVSEDIQMIIAHIISQWMFDQLSDQTI